MMDNFTTATGKEFQTDYLVTIQKPPMLFVRVIGGEKDEIKAIFKNPEETKELTYNNNVYEGYTHFESISDEGNAWKVVLSK